MKKPIELGIGFVTGRTNVCEIINNYYKDILNQTSNHNVKINITFFILYDLNYQSTKREDFYNIISDVYENINIKYITPENIKEEEKRLISRRDISKEEVGYILGYGHAKGRNTILYFATKKKMDYLLFWDDDEYPVACYKDKNNKLIWKKQDNILQHIINLEETKADVSIGYHCGYISPIPYLELKNSTYSEKFKQYINAISNEIISWDNIQKNMKENKGITYADPLIIDQKNTYEKQKIGDAKWVAGSTLCLNLKNLDKIPAFYNPPGARGEDTFFSTWLNECRVIKTSIYHFHDGFLQHKDIMKGNMPNKLEKVDFNTSNVKERFLKASLGWLKYKPLLLYITDNRNYEKKINEMKTELKSSMEYLKDFFDKKLVYNFTQTVEKYDSNVKKHYKKYLKTNEVWNKMKEILKDI